MHPFLLCCYAMLYYTAHRYHNITQLQDIPNTIEEITLVDKISHDDIDKTLIFTRTTPYANNKGMTLLSKAITKRQKNKTNPRKITPAKLIVTKRIPIYPSIKTFLVKKTLTQAIIMLCISSKRNADASKYPPKTIPLLAT